MSLDLGDEIVLVLGDDRFLATLAGDRDGHGVLPVVRVGSPASAAHVEYTRADSRVWQMVRRPPCLRASPSDIACVSGLDGLLNIDAGG
jgi:hypothetical protein